MIYSRLALYACYIMICMIPVFTHASSVSLSATTTRKIMALQDAQSMASILVHPVSTTTAVVFKKGVCAQSRLIDDSAYFLAVINNAKSLSSAYIPKNLVDIRPWVSTNMNSLVCVTKTTASQLYTMIKDMEKENLKLVVVSGYRSFAEQKILYKIQAPLMNIYMYDRVALAGKSEHQLGTAVDVANEKTVGVEFGTSSESVWLKNNAYKYGFTYSYEEGSEEKTGYMYEPWHLRYVGVENAILLKKGQYSLAFKSAYYTQGWMNTLLNRLKESMEIPVPESGVGG